MAELSLNEPAGILVKTTCVDFPGRIAGSFFLKGCNLRCPYCYNIDLVTGCNSDGFSTVQQFFDHLEKRKNVLSAVVISGGEPMLNSYTPLIIKKAKELGYKVKLDTNGTLPDKLKTFVENKDLCPDYVAMDIKTSPVRYTELICNKDSKLYKNKDTFETLLSQSSKIICSLPKECREFRTVLVPALVTRDDIIQMSKILPDDACWRFAQFQNKNCLNPKYNNICPYTDEEANKLVNFAKTLIPDSELR